MVEVRHVVPLRAREDDVLALSRLPMRASGSSGSSGHVDAGWMTAPGGARDAAATAKSLDIARITIRTTRAGLLWPY